MPSIPLDDRALIRVAGADAEHLLQNIITTDLDALQAGDARPSALLTPQGKILFDFLISRDGKQGFVLDCRRDVAADLVRRLMLYRLRAKADISLDEDAKIYTSWGAAAVSSRDESTSSDSDSAPGSQAAVTVRDMRFPAALNVVRIYGQGVASTDDPEIWTRLRIANGIAESGADYALGDAFPHDVLLDELGAVGFQKGCYVGQEVVSRMQHRGTARRRILIVSAASDLPASGTELVAGGRAVATLGTVSGAHGLAIARIDKVKAALDVGEPITAGGGVPVELAIPAWARFTFPQVEAETI